MGALLDGGMEMVMLVSLRSITALFLMTSVLAFCSDSVQIDGYISGKGFDATGTRSWLEGGWGRLASGDNQDAQGALRAEAAISWEPSLWFRAYVHGLARLEPSDYEGDTAGLVEAYVEAMARVNDVSRFRFRLGLFFPPTSMENTGPLWTSPYTLSYSALNSWIGEEVRVMGLDVSYAHEFASGKDIFWGASVFGGNDTAGALLAWRGWTLGDRLTGAGEVLPLPNHASLGLPEGDFALQRDSGTRPFSSDLDDRLGYAARVGFDLQGRWIVQANWSNNRADRRLYNGDYAWETEWISLGAELEVAGNLTFIGEFMTGDTGMGFQTFGNGHVQLDFESYYGMLTWYRNGWRVSGRYDDFMTRDLDADVAGYNADLNDETGDALTLAVLWEFTDRWRFGIERVDLTVTRPAVTPGGPRVFRGGEAWTLEARYSF